MNIINVSYQSLLAIGMTFLSIFKLPLTSPAGRKPTPLSPAMLLSFLPDNPNECSVDKGGASVDPVCTFKECFFGVSFSSPCSLSSWLLAFLPLVVCSVCEPFLTVWNLDEKENIAICVILS